MLVEQLNATTYETTLLGGDKVEIGDKESADFKPHIKLNRWDGECFIAIQPAGEIEEVEYEVDGDKIKCKYKVKQDDLEFEWETEFYPLEPRTVIAKDKEGKDVEFKQNELGGFEFEVILKKKPLTNKIVLNIEMQGLKFFYQPALTQEEIDEGCIRPDNVVGSYAVCHATRTSFHRSGADAEKYKCGIAFNIYRPKITDAEGKWIWGELSLDEQAGTLTTTISQDFLDTAAYPVSTGTTNFGYEAIGGSATNTGSFTIMGSHFLGVAGTATSITAHTYNSATGWKWKNAIYRQSDRVLVDGTNEATWIDTGWAWRTATFASPPVLTAIEYWLLWWAERSSSACLMRYRTGDANQGANDDRIWNGWYDPITFDETDNKEYSIFCTVEEEAGPEVVEGSASGSGIGLASSLAKLDVLAQTLGNGIGLSTSTSLLTITGQVQGSGVGLSQTTSYLIIPASAIASGLGISSTTGVIVKLGAAAGSGIGTSTAQALVRVLASASGSGIGLASATGEIVIFLVTGTGAGSGVGTATAQGILDVIASASGSGVGEATVQAILDILAEAQGSGVGLGSTEALIRVLAAAAASGEGLGSAEALLEVIAQATGEGIGTGQGQSYVIIFGSGQGSGIGLGVGTGVTVKLGQALGSGIGSGTADALLKVLAEALGSGIGLGVAEGLILIVILSSETGIGIERATRAGWLMKPVVYTKNAFAMKTYTGE